ncbi:MAG: hypothetical protein H0U66_04735, partial [Gemmatimonadaceae bacterium]|nr:hypothetical protein [Gemmatimonadaceae bacterium]
MDNRSDPDARAVLEDWERSHWGGASSTATLGRALDATDYTVADAVNGNDADDDDDDDG